MARYRIAPVGIIDQDNGDELILPNYPGWSEYEQWLNAPVDPRNFPDPAIVEVYTPTPEEIAQRAEYDARAAIAATLRADVEVQALMHRTPAEIEAWIGSTVQGMPDVRDVLAQVCKVVALLARERIP
jgi:hypothetical protein